MASSLWGRNKIVDPCIVRLGRSLKHILHTYRTSEICGKKGPFGQSGVTALTSGGYLQKVTSFCAMLLRLDSATSKKHININILKPCHYGPFLLSVCG